MRSVSRVHGLQVLVKYSAQLQALVEALEINMSVASLDLAGCFEITNKGAEAEDFVPV